MAVGAARSRSSTAEKHRRLSGVFKIESCVSPGHAVTDMSATERQKRQPPPPEQIGPRHFPPETGSLFEEVASLRYPFQVLYSAEDYLANLTTQSGTQALGPARSAEFLARVRHRLESLRCPQLTATFVGPVGVGPVGVSAQVSPAVCSRAEGGLRRGLL